MARYGYTLYGLRKYGEIDETRVYYVSGLTGYYTDYNRIEITWGPINGDSLDLPITHWRLIRTVGGVPDHPNDGTILDGDVITSFRVSFVDNSIASSGIDSEVFYSIWAFNGQDWIESGHVGFTVVQDLRTQQLMLEMLPPAWSNEVGGVGDATGEQEPGSDLGVFVDSLAFMYDKLSAETRLVSNIFDYRRVPTKLLVQHLENLGMSPEPTLGDTFHRSLYRVGNIVNQYKGTKKGIVNYIAGLTHWASTVENGRNLLNNFDDSSFELTTGWWVASHGTLTNESYADPADAPTFYLEDEDNPARRAGYGEIVSVSSGTTTLRPPADPLLHGVSVEPGLTYAFKGYFRTSGTTNVTLNIDWFDFKGTFVSTTTGTSTLIDESWTLVIVEGDAPSSAIYCQPSMVFDDTTDPVQIDMLELFQVDVTQPASRLTFEDARRARIRLIADRTNLIPNPAFDNGVGGWLPYNATFSQNFEVAGVFGAACAEVASTGDDSAIVSEWIPVDSESPYTFSAYLQGTGTATLRIEYSHPQTAVEQIAVQTSGGNTYYVGGQHIVEETIDLVEGEWVRGYVTSVSPEYTADTGSPLAKASIIFNGTADGDASFVDCVLLEPTPILRDFFQGNGAPAPENAGTQPTIYANDCKWEVQTHYNFVQEPSFVSGWTGVTRVTSGTGDADAVYGTHNGEGSGTTPAATVVPIPESVTRGGRDIVGSVFLFSATAGTFTIELNGATHDFVVGSGQVGNWVRMHVRTVAEPGTTNYSFSVTAGQAGTWYINAPQVEIGNVPTSFVDFTSSDTIVSSVDGATYRASREAIQYGARSYYWTRLSPRITRLAANLPNQTMLNTDWVLELGERTPKPVESDSSLALSASFENGIEGWAGDNATLVRRVATGSVFGSTALHGGSYGEVTNASTGAYGIVSDLIEVRPFAGHYAAIAIKPVDSASLGNVTLRVDWLDDFANPVIVDEADYYAETTRDIQTTEEWSYVMLTSPSKTAAYAQISIMAEDGNGFLVDHILFRE